jgi:hypothetical protein
MVARKSIKSDLSQGAAGRSIGIMKGVTLVALFGLAALSDNALAASRFTVGPFASVSSTKSIKPTADKESSEEVVTQRTTYGLRIGVGLSRFFGLDIKGGVNEVDRTKKAVAMRDEFGDIDFQKDANVNPDDQNATYRYQESQKVGTAKLVFSPRLFSFVWLNGTKQVIDDPIRYHAIGSAGLGFRLLRAFTGSIEYSFYFLKFPELEPHEQEVAVSFGVSI